jgi:hypothetical protein
LENLIPTPKDTKKMDIFGWSLEKANSNYCPPFENFCPRNLFGVKQAFFDRTGEKYTGGLFSTPTNSD